MRREHSRPEHFDAGEDCACCAYWSERAVLFEAELRRLLAIPDDKDRPIYILTAVERLRKEAAK